MGDFLHDYRPEFVAALRLLAKALATYCKSGRDRPVLVGGAAVEYYTVGNYQTGDLDIAEADEQAFAEAIAGVGFRAEDRGAHLLRGYYHPELGIGVELVSRPLFDGRTDRSRLGSVMLDGLPIALPPVEDLIADRLAQYEVSMRRDAELLVQARLLHELAEHVDQDFLLRCREELADIALLRDEEPSHADPA